MTTRAPLQREAARDRVAEPAAAAGHDRDLAGELGRARPPPSLPGPLPAPRHGIDWKRLTSALIRFAVSMSRSVIFIPASWVQNENETML